MWLNPKKHRKNAKIDQKWDFLSLEHIKLQTIDPQPHKYRRCDMFFGDVDYDFCHTLCKKVFHFIIFLYNQDALLNFLSKTTIYLLFKYKIENLEVGRDFLGEHNFVSKNNSMFQLKIMLWELKDYILFDFVLIF